jgi:hypothetical protein
MSHPSFANWHKAVTLEHNEDLKQITKATVIGAQERYAVRHEVIIRLESRGMRYSRVWNEKVSELELLNDPKMFRFRLQSDQTGVVNGEILTVERSGRDLSLTLAGNDPFSIAVDDEIKILPSLFLEKLKLRMEDRQHSETSSHHDYIAQCHDLFTGAEREAATLRVGDDPGAGSAYADLNILFVPPKQPRLKRVDT